ncbi:MAG: LTA synthase family protein, partial [Candidatus Woesearchaeota archaeon]
NRYGLIIFFFLASLLFEIIFFNVIGFGFVPEYFVLNLSVLLIIASIILFLPSFKVQLVVTSIIFGLQVLISYINVTLHNVFGQVATVDMLKLINEATRAVEASFINVKTLLGFAILFSLFLYTNIKIFKKVKDKEPRGIKLKFSFAVVLVLMISQITGFGAYAQQSNALQTLADDHERSLIENDGYLYDTLVFQAESLKRFGTFSYYFRGIGNTFSYLNGNERQELVKNVQDYINDSPEAPVNEYTGVSEDNNAIVLMAESLEWAAIDPELTPNLHSLKQNSVSMSNFHSKSKTNISEAQGFLGSYPLEQSFGNNLPGTPDLMQNNFDHSLPNVLKDQGYEGGDYFINHEKDFYNRDKTHENFGFNDVYDVSDFDIKDNEIEEWGDWVLDSEVVKGSMDKIAPETDSPFFTWMTTMLMHGPYEGNYRLEPYFEDMDDMGWENPYKDTEIEKQFRHYMATAMDVDRAVKLLMDNLEDRGILDETTILMYGDHQAYYNNLGPITKGVEEYYEPDNYKVPFMIYDENLPAKEVDDFSSLYDILPTILDLLGINYKKNMYMGNSVLDSKNNTDVFMSPLGGLFNEKFYTANGREILYNPDEYTQEEIEEFRQSIEDVVEKAVMLDKMYLYQVFNEQ